MFILILIPCHFNFDSVKHVLDYRGEVGGLVRYENNYLCHNQEVTSIEKYFLKNFK